MWFLATALAASVWTEAGVTRLQGAVLDGYRLVRALGEAEEEALSGSHGKYPLEDEYPKAKYLRSGSFGEAWEAVETLSDGAEHKVVLKIFYEKDAYGRIQYLTKEKMRAGSKLEKQVKEAVQECHLANRIVQDAPAGDAGASRIVNCLHDKVTHRKPKEALFLVLEHGGTSLDAWLQGEGQVASLEERRTVVGQLLQGLRTMGEHVSPPLVHHDLKPGNAVYDGKTARLIDFGGTMVGTSQNRLKPAVATPGYAPPEFLGLAGQPVSFHMPAVSYDVFALGMIYAEVMCAGKTASGRGYNLDLASLAAFARSAIKSGRTLRTLLAPCPTRVPEEDQAAMLSMLAFHAAHRPLPSAALAAAPFAGMLADLEASSASYEPPVIDGGDLASSILAKSWDNPNARGGAGFFTLEDEGKWQANRQCVSTLAQPIKTLTDPTNTKEQCEAECIVYSITNQDMLKQLYGGRQLCCQLDVNRDAAGRKTHQCYVGRPELEPTVFIRYAALLPMNSDGPAKPVAGRVFGDGAPEDRGQDFGDKTESPKVLRNQVRGLAAQEPVVGRVFGDKPAAKPFEPFAEHRRVAERAGLLVHHAADADARQDRAPRRLADRQPVVRLQPNAVHQPRGLNGLVGPAAVTPGWQVNPGGDVNVMGGRAFGGLGGAGRQHFGHGQPFVRRGF